ncbi:NADPH-dependent ferric siderophore reductase [Amycolatopsis antarctica]|uniref:NADPH-dependent ferric siderophore reductase n=1 Tax=Amycolatopsis antarctica TaxID=1854586 RepID=A0A263D9Y2_9PSEU|nr:siderophore-interacting protein [Amycolatopsis antarctica]OZM74286.1 NADPH-dependent ferric siderophore reductase [Amycolatopsis antarctica]
MADRPVRKGKPSTTLRVLRKENLTPHMIRIVAGGPDLSAFEGLVCTDSYVKLLIPVPGVRYPEPFDMQAVRENFPREQWPRTRTYTVRHVDMAAGELTLDFVHHGDQGLAGPWAVTAQPGDELVLLGPGGGYAPSAEADRHLLVGDESALPAIAVALEAMPAGAPVQVFVEVEDAAEEQPLATEADARIHWVHRSSGADLVAAVREPGVPAGTVQAFVHGEAGFVRELRRYLLTECGVRKDLLSISGYWRRGKDDEAWRAEKAAEKAAESAAEKANA